MLWQTVDCIQQVSSKSTHAKLINLQMFLCLLQPPKSCILNVVVSLLIVQNALRADVGFRISAIQNFLIYQKCSVNQRVQFVQLLWQCLKLQERCGDFLTWELKNEDILRVIL